MCRLHIQHKHFLPILSFQEEASAAVSRLLSYVTPGWRRRGALRPRILDVRVAGARLRAALHDLAVFADATLANAHDAQDKGRNNCGTKVDYPP